MRSGSGPGALPPLVTNLDPLCLMSRKSNSGSLLPIVYALISTLTASAQPSIESPTKNLRLRSLTPTIAGNCSV